MNIMFRFAIWLIFGVSALSSAHAGTLQDVMARDRLICGVDEQHFGFSFLNDQGDWEGFEVDFCRALSAAILSDPQKIEFIALNSQNRFTALRDKQVDILLRSTTWTYARDVSFGFDFPVVTFYDHMAILAHKNAGIINYNEMQEGTLCVANATTTLEKIRQALRETRKDLIIKVFNSREGLNNMFFSGQCDFYAADHSALISTLYIHAPRIGDYIFLEDTNLSKEPLGPVVRGEDPQWTDIVRWLVFGLIEAEEIGLSQQKLKTYEPTKNRHMDFLLGKSPGIGPPLGLNDDWLAQALHAVGNYGEIFDRNLGANSPFKMERGLNGLWTEGGLMYAIPLK